MDYEYFRGLCVRCGLCSVQAMAEAVCSVSPDWSLSAAQEQRLLLSSLLTGYELRVCERASQRR